MERAVRMQFANLMFDTWIENSGGSNSLRRQIADLAERISQRVGLDPLEIPIRDRDGLLLVSCPNLHADLETARNERGCAIFTVNPDGLHQLMPRFSTTADQQGATLRIGEASGPGRALPRAEEGHDLAPLALFGPAVPAEPAWPPDLDDVGPLFGSDALSTWPRTPDFESADLEDRHATNDPSGGHRIHETAPISLREAMQATRSERHSPAERPSPIASTRTRIVRLKLVDAMGHKLGDHDYRLGYEGVLLEGRSDADGALELHLPPYVHEAVLTLLLSDEPGHALSWPLHLASEPSCPEWVALRSKLHGLGYDSGSLSPNFDLGLAQALQRFQREHGLHADGACDEATRTLLGAGGSPA